MPEHRSTHSRPLDDDAGQGYWSVSRQPLQVLAFLIPIIAAYELGLASALRQHDNVLTNLAHKRLLQFFDAFGVSPSGGLFVGGIVIVAVLLAWHVLARHRWHVNLSACGFMAIESILLALPLVLLGQLTGRLLDDLSDPLAAVVLMQSDGSGTAGLGDLSLAAKISISLGAGLYEELVFRMLLIAMVHTIVVDMAKLPHRWGVIAAIAVSAIAFALYHPLHDAAGSLSAHRVCFFLLAGVYFALLYVVRGFGIVVGAHAAYDIVTIVLLPQ